MVLEFLKGVHPFAGMSEQVINFQLVSKGIQVPADLSAEWSELLKGLLTRDHEKRWQGVQVANWLAGQRNQAVYYEGDRQQTYTHKPYQFAGKDIYTAKELAVALSEDWDAGVKNFGRGYVIKWTEEDLRNFDLASRLRDLHEDKALSGDEQLSLALAEMNRELPGIWKGSVVNREWVGREPEQFQTLLQSRIRPRLEQQPGWPIELVKQLTEVKAAKLSPEYLAAMERIIITGNPQLKIGEWAVTPGKLVANPDKAVALLESKVPSLYQKFTGQTWLAEAAARWVQSKAVGVLRGYLKHWAFTGEAMLKDGATPLNTGWLSTHPDKAITVLESSLPEFWANQTGEKWLAEAAERWARTKTLEATRDWLWSWACTGEPILSRDGIKLSPEWLTANPKQAVVLLESSLPEFWAKTTGQTWLAEAAGEWMDLWPQVDALGCGTSKSAALPWIIGSSETLVAETQRRLQKYVGTTDATVNRFWESEQLDPAQCIALCAIEEEKLLTPEAKAGAEAAAQAEHEEESLQYLKSFGAEMDWDSAMEWIRAPDSGRIWKLWRKAYSGPLASALKQNPRLAQIMGAETQTYLDVLAVCLAYVHEKKVREVGQRLEIEEQRLEIEEQRLKMEREIERKAVRSRNLVRALLACLALLVGIWATVKIKAAADKVAAEKAAAADLEAERAASERAAADLEAEKAASERAAAKAAAAWALAATEARIQWTGAAMQRAKFPMATITKALTQGGTVVAWGSNSDGQTRVPNGLAGVVAIAAGYFHTVALKLD